MLLAELNSLIFIWLKSYFFLLYMTNYYNSIHMVCFDIFLQKVFLVFPFDSVSYLNNRTTLIHFLIILMSAILII